VLARHGPLATYRSRRSGGGTAAPLFSRIHTSLISVWRAISRAQVEVRPQWENGAPNNASSQTKNYEITPFILGDGGIVPFEPFFMLFPAVWRKQ
jgi:hypothetical protein